MGLPGHLPDWILTTIRATISDAPKKSKRHQCLEVDRWYVSEKFHQIKYILSVRDNSAKK